MRSRYESLQSDVNTFLKHHPERLRRQKSYLVGPLGILSVEKVVDYPLSIAVGKIGIQSIFSFSKRNRVIGQTLTTFIDDSERSRQIWIPYGVAYRGAHILATNERLMEDGFAKAQGMLKINLPTERAELDLFEEARDMLVAVGASEAEDEVHLLSVQSGEIILF
jgi:hypothetical protein